MISRHTVRLIEVGKVRLRALHVEVNVIMWYDFTWDKRLGIDLFRYEAYACSGFLAVVGNCVLKETELM